MAGLQATEGNTVGWRESFDFWFLVIQDDLLYLFDLILFTSEDIFGLVVGNFISELNHIITVIDH